MSALIVAVFVIIGIFSVGAFAFCSWLDKKEEKKEALETRKGK